MPIQHSQNKWVRLSGRLSFVLSILQMGFFSLANAGITKYLPFFCAMVVFVAGMYGATLLRERAEKLDINGYLATKADNLSAIAIPLLLIIAFAMLLIIQME